MVQEKWYRNGTGHYSHTDSSAFSYSLPFILAVSTSGDEADYGKVYDIWTKLYPELSSLLIYQGFKLWEACTKDCAYSCHWHRKHSEDNICHVCVPSHPLLLCTPASFTFTIAAPRHLMMFLSHGHPFAPCIVRLVIFQNMPVADPTLIMVR